MRALEKTASFLIGLIGMLWIFGGFRIRTESAKIELASVDAFSALLLICFLVLAWKHRSWDLFSWNSTFGARLQKGWHWIEDRKPSQILIFLVFVFVTLFLAHWVRHLTLMTHVYDMVFQHQPLYYPFTPRFLHCDMCMQQTLMAEHLVWTWGLLIPIAQFFQSDTVLFFTQAFFVAFALWIFATKGPLQDRPRLWLPFLLFFILFRPLRESVIWDFREDVLGFFFLTMGLTLLWNQKRFFAFLFFALACFTKESFPVAVALLGLVLCFERYLPLEKNQKRAFGLALLALGGFIFILNSKLFFPYFMQDSQGSTNVLRRFPGFGNSFDEFFLNVLQRPLDFLLQFGSLLLRKKSVQYFLMIFVPFLLFLRRAWLWMLPVGFFVFLYMMSAVEGQVSGSAHYELILLPFMMMTAACAGRDFETQSPAPSLWAWSLVLMLCWTGRGPVFEVTDRFFEKGKDIPVAWEAQSWKFDAPVAASERVLPQILKNPQLRFIQNPTQELSADENENRRLFLAANPPTQKKDQLRDFSDALHWVLDLRNPWEAWLAKQLQLLGGKSNRVAADSNGQSQFLWIEFSPNLRQVWCDKEQVCP